MIQEGGTYSASDLVMFGDYRVRLKSAIEEQRERVIAAQKVANEALERYVEASKEAKALEMLRQRREAEYTQGILKEEGAQLDEVAVQRAPGRDEERF
jgi:flagellar export protein FliJ